jgi:hypothetical protein
MSTSAARLLPFIIAFALVSGLRAHTIDIVELPNEGGIRIFTDGNLLNFFPGAESAIVGANFNDGNYVPQGINVDLYDDPAHTIVSDRIDITVPAQNPGQITVGLTSDTEGVPLAPLSPENLALTETGALQNILTLTNSNGIQTTIRIQSDLDTPTAAAPEPASFTFAFLGCVAVTIAVISRRQYT